MLGSLKDGGRHFQAVGPAWQRIHARGPIVLLEVAGTHKLPDVDDLRCERPGSKAKGFILYQNSKHGKTPDIEPQTVGG